MRKQTVIDYFGTRTALAKALGISKSAVSLWKGEFIPENHAYRVERITRRKLRVDPAHYERSKTGSSSVG